MAITRIAVVGSGPRGLSIVERLAARLDGAPIDLYLIDAVEVGCGRVWRSDQPAWFLMNTVCGEVTMFSGPSDGGPPRPGAGPSLAQWWAGVDPDCPGPNGYAPRAVHGRYQRFMLDTVERTLPVGARLHRIQAEVVDLAKTGDGYRLSLHDGRRIEVDRVVLTTGHSVPDAAGEQAVLERFAADRPHLRYLRAVSASDLDLDAIAPGEPVGVVGLGLSFYDVVNAFTFGRGGTLDGDAYTPSGREPLIIAGSRSGLPVPARGRNQKSSAPAFRPVLFTPERVRGARRHGSHDFIGDVLPWAMAEIELVYYRTALRLRAGEAAASVLTDEVLAADGVPDVVAVAARLGVGDLPRLDLDALARPFAAGSFPDPAAFTDAVVRVLLEDLEHAEQGNVDSPLKAALDVLRDTRWVVRQVVDYAGLLPDSHRVDFLGWFAQRSSFLAAGPPRARVRQVLGFLASGVLRLVGPHTVFEADAERDTFVVSSPAVAGSAVPVTTLIDARVPDPDMRRDPSPLTTRLRERGIWTSFANGTFQTGGVAVTASPYHPIGRDGTPDEGLYVLGIPTEHTRWFTLVGSGRPGPWNEFTRDADAIAAHALTARTFAGSRIPEGATK